MKMRTQGMRLQSFIVSEKLRTVQEAEEIGNCAAGKNATFLKVV
jgi:hypothetical protein